MQKGDFTSFQGCNKLSSQMDMCRLSNSSSSLRLKKMRARIWWSSRLGLIDIYKNCLHLYYSVMLETNQISIRLYLTWPELQEKLKFYQSSGPRTILCLHMPKIYIHLQNLKLLHVHLHMPKKYSGSKCELTL